MKRRIDLRGRWAWGMLAWLGLGMSAAAVIGITDARVSAWLYFPMLIVWIVVLYWLMAHAA